MTKQIFTLADARDERVASKINLAAEKADALKAEIAAILRDHPEIGVLNSGKFYVYPVGGQYREADHPAKLI